MPSRFHEDALRRLATPYQPDPAATRALEARANELGIALPASFAEWYGMRDGVELLKRNSNCDEPLGVEDLGKRFKWRGLVAEDWLAQGLLIFMFENQSVCVWALQLDGGDDPPVLVARDPELEWVECAQSFSTFVACQVWDHAEVLGTAEGSTRLLVQAQDIPLQSEDLAFLRRTSVEKPATHGWPADNQYRFERGNARVLIWDGKDQADWWIAAPDVEDLALVVEDLWDCGGLRTTLWCTDERCQAVLEGIRADRPLQ
jgi:hypothetical protein